MIKSLKRLGKAKLKYRFDVVVHSATVVPSPSKWTPAPLMVSWTRGPRSARTGEAEFVTNSGIVEWQAKLCMLATLYKSAEADRADVKEYRLSLLAVDASASGKPKTKVLATAKVDLGEFARATAKPITKTIALRPKSKRVADAALTVTITAVCLAGAADTDADAAADDSLSAGSEFSCATSDDGSDAAASSVLRLGGDVSSDADDNTDTDNDNDAVAPSDRLPQIRRAPPPARRPPSTRAARRPADDGDANASGPGATAGGAGGAKEVRYLQKMLQQQLSDAWKDKQVMEEKMEELELEVQEKAAIVLQYKAQLDEADERIAELESEQGASGTSSGTPASGPGATREELLALLEASTDKVRALKAKNKARKVEVTSLETRLAAAELALERRAAVEAMAPPPSLPPTLAYRVESATATAAVLRTPGGRQLEVRVDSEVPGYGRVVRIDADALAAETTSGRVIGSGAGSRMRGESSAAAAAPATPTTSSALADRRAMRQLTEDYNETCDKLAGAEKQNELLTNQVHALEELVALYAPEEVRHPTRFAPGTEADDTSLTEDGVRIRALETMLELAVAETERAKHEAAELESEYVSAKLALAQTEFEKQAAQKDLRVLQRKYAKARDLHDAMSQKMTRMEVELAQFHTA